MIHEPEPGTFEHDEALRAKRRKVIYLNLGGACFALVLFWGALIAKVLLGWDVFSLLHHGDRVTNQHALYVVLGATAFLVVLTLWRIRSSLMLVDHGVEITGRVISLSVLRSHGMRPVRFEYEYDGVRYDRAVDLGSDDAAGLKPGSPIVLLVNSKKPNHAMPKCKVGI